MSTTPEDFSLIRVLVVDDQSHVRTFVRKVLQTMGITNVTEAADGRDALAAVTQPGAWFDVILCDLQMPERDGIETIRSFGALGLESAIVIMSMETERVIETASLLAGAQGLRVFGTITKPLTAEKLQPILRRLREVPELPVRDALVKQGRDLKAAFKNAEFFLQYQPKLVMRTGKFAGVEALVRWKHPELGVLQPESFLSVLEEDAQYGGALTDVTLRAAIGCAGRWQQAGRELGIAVNLPVRAFDRLDLPERMEALARDARVSPERITFEVNETDVARDMVRMIDVAARLRLKKFQLSIDKFGTGQFGLKNLQQLPFNELKIDRSFVHGCSASTKQRSVVEASIALARTLEMTSVAVGIQQRPDWDLLNELGCDKMQGFFIARPMSEEGLEAWAAQWMLK